jgi:hypothetical protein
MENKNGKQKDGKQMITTLIVIAENKEMENKYGKQTTLLIY